MCTLKCDFLDIFFVLPKSCLGTLVILSQPATSVGLHGCPVVLENRAQNPRKEFSHETGGRTLYMWHKSARCDLVVSHTLPLKA